MKIKLTHDVHNIAKRVKEIDKSYYLVFDTSSNQFELHSDNQIGTTYCLAFPYSSLDERVLNYIHQTKSEHIEEILNKIEQHNEKIESDEKTNTLNSFQDCLTQQTKEFQFDKTMNEKEKL